MLASKFFFSQLYTALPFVATIVLYFYFQPAIHFSLSVLFFSCFVLGFFCDAKLTIKNSQYIANHETNVLFPALYARFGPRAGGTIQFLFELAIAFLLPLFFIEKLDIVASSVIAATLGASHFFAFYANKKFVMNI
ncbi:MAG: hypothetical protein ACT4NT_02960 [Nitrososphaerota archaeon]